jgi:lipopolysaccharide export LptBFGC system permease protein LptF
MIVNRMVQNFGDAYHLPAVLSYLLPSLLLAIGAIFALRRTV